MTEEFIDIENLIIKFLRKELNPNEELKLQEWIAVSDKNKELFDRLVDKNILQKKLKTFHQIETGDKQESRIKIFEQLFAGGKVVPLNKFKMLRRWIAAAAILIFLLAGYWFFVQNNKEKSLAKTMEQRFKNDLAAPNKVSAVITLANGKKVYLDSANNGTVATEGNVQVIKTADGKLIYSRESGVATAALQYNTLFNPKGSKVIDMTLADGSHVWLNAGSSITYPVAFVTNERKVSITGEAYFEVIHNAAKKFIVDANGVSTEVLGTHFNVNSYADEGKVKITLLEGSVKVSMIDGESSMIKPGEQAQITSSINVAKNVDLDEVMAWKNGKFILNDATIESIMKDVERWYNAEIIYKGKINYHFVGTLPRDVPVSKLLQMLELTGRVKFLIEDKKITVME